MPAELKPWISNQKTGKWTSSQWHLLLSAYGQEQHECQPHQSEKRSRLSHWLWGMSIRSHHGHLLTLMNYTISLHFILLRHSNQEGVSPSPLLRTKSEFPLMCSECLSSRPPAQFRKPRWSSVSHLLAPNGRESISPVLSIFPSLSTESSQPASRAAVANRVLKLGGLSSDHPEQLSWSFQTMASSRDRPQGLA